MVARLASRIGRALRREPRLKPCDRQFQVIATEPHRHVVRGAGYPRPVVSLARPRGVGRLVPGGVPTRMSRVGSARPQRTRPGGRPDSRHSPPSPHQVTWMPDHLPFRSGLRALVRHARLRGVWRRGERPTGHEFVFAHVGKHPNANWPYKCVPLMVLTPAHPDFPSRDARQQGSFHSGSDSPFPFTSPTPRPSRGAPSPAVRASGGSACGSAVSSRCPRSARGRSGLSWLSSPAPLR